MCTSPESNALHSLKLTDSLHGMLTTTYMSSIRPARHVWQANQLHHMFNQPKCTAGHSRCSYTSHGYVSMVVMPQPDAFWKSRSLLRSISLMLSTPVHPAPFLSATCLHSSLWEAAAIQLHSPQTLYTHTSRRPCTGTAALASAAHHTPAASVSSAQRCHLLGSWLGSHHHQQHAQLASCRPVLHSTPWLQGLWYEAPKSKRTSLLWLDSQ